MTKRAYMLPSRDVDGAVKPSKEKGDGDKHCNARRLKMTAKPCRMRAEVSSSWTLMSIMD